MKLGPMAAAAAAAMVVVVMVVVVVVVVTRCNEGRALHDNINEVEVLVEQFENEARAKDDEVKLLGHQRYVGCFATSGTQIDGDD